MGLLGGSATGGMQKSYKQNKDLGNRKKSLQERTKGYETKSNTKFEKRELTEDQRIEHEARLKKNKRSDLTRIILVFAIIAAVIGAIAIYG
ncbi:MAG: hypothetical protein DCO96_13980 [Fluviicola sp. XM-24bin1]|nr:MAG: hypothetical protein DCO96_13980 [Fluviicola sp. XM-24bin1]